MAVSADRAVVGRSDQEAIGWWLLTRVGVVLVFVSAPWLVGDAPVPLLESVARWDVVHLLAIAEQGYSGLPADQQPTGVPLQAFFPGLPLLIALGTVIGLPAAAAGLLVSLVAGLIAAIALSRLADLEVGAGAGSRAALAWMVAPVGVFLFLPYTEALFCALAFPAWLAARRGNWMLAAVLAAGAASVRVSGIFLAVALVVEFTTSKHRDWRRAPWLLLPAVPVLAYMTYLHQLTGDWLAWYEAQKQEWNRGFTWPWESFANTVAASDVSVYGANFAWMFRAEIVAMAAGIFVTVALLALRRWGDATWIGIQVLAFSTSYWFFSVPRATLLWWPVFLGLAWAAKHKPWLWRAYLVISIPLMALWAVTFAQGRWAG